MCYFHCLIIFLTYFLYLLIFKFIYLFIFSFHLVSICWSDGTSSIKLYVFLAFDYYWHWCSVCLIQGDHEKAGLYYMVMASAMEINKLQEFVSPYYGMLPVVLYFLGFIPSNHVSLWYGPSNHMSLIWFTFLVCYLIY